MRIQSKQNKMANRLVPTVRKPRHPYFRPEEHPATFDTLATAYLRHFRPSDPESEALVHTLTYVGWRLKRYRLDQSILEITPASDEQAAALKNVQSLIESLERIGASTTTALQYLQRVHALDASEALDPEAESDQLGSFRQKTEAPAGAHIPAPPPPKTRPN